MAIFITTAVTLLTAIICCGSMGFGYAAPVQRDLSTGNLLLLTLVACGGLVIVGSVSTLTTRVLGVSWQTAALAAAYSQSPLLIVYAGLFLSSQLRDSNFVSWLPPILLYVASPVLNVLVALTIDGILTRKILVIELALAGVVVLSPIMWIVAPAAAGLLRQRATAENRAGKAQGRPAPDR